LPLLRLQGGVLFRSEDGIFGWGGLPASLIGRTDSWFTPSGQQITVRDDSLNDYDARCRPSFPNCFSRQPSVAFRTQRQIHREVAKSAKNREEATHKPFTIRLMPSLIRGTFQFTRRPSRCPESFRYFFIISFLRVLRVFAVRRRIDPISRKGCTRINPPILHQKPLPVRRGPPDQGIAGSLADVRRAGMVTNDDRNWPAACSSRTGRGQDSNLSPHIPYSQHNPTFTRRIFAGNLHRLQKLGAYSFLRRP